MQYNIAPAICCIMIIGNGLVATAFRQYDPGHDTVIVAAGVSDSTTKSPAAFAREETLLRGILDKHPGKTIVYISTCSIYDASLQSSPYVLHKLAIEAIIMQSAAAFHILRMTNLVGNSPKATTFFHQLTEHIRSGTAFDLWVHARRNIIDYAQAARAGSHILSQDMYRKTITNIAHPLKLSRTPDCRIDRPAFWQDTGFPFH